MNINAFYYAMLALGAITAFAVFLFNCRKQDGRSFLRACSIFFISLLCALTINALVSHLTQTHNNNYYITLVAFCLFCAITLKRCGLNNYINKAAPSLSIFSAISRIGCIFVGCCGGTHFPIAFMELVFGVAAFIYLQFLCKKDGLIRYLTVYSAFRLATDFLRVEPSILVRIVAIALLLGVALYALLALSKSTSVKPTKKTIVSLMLAVILTMSVGLSGCTGTGDGDGSSTNVQEEGIDEGDIVKISNGYVFKAQKDGVSVSYVDKDGKIDVVSKNIAHDFKPKELFVYKDYLVVIGEILPIAIYQNGEIVSYTKHKMVVSIYDLSVSSDEEVVLLRTDEFYGTYRTSRMIDDSLYLLTNYSYDLEQTYTDYFKGEKPLDMVYRDDETANYYGGYLIAKLNLEQTSMSYLTALYAERQVYDIYCSKYGFYAMKGAMVGVGCNTFMITDSIDRISLDTLQRVGTAKNFNGLSPDRFCLYDNGTNLYVVNQKMVTQLFQNKKAVGTYLYVYDNEMNLVNSLGPMAKDENLFSARFVDDNCYIVTAKHANSIYIDPLMKIDISTSSPEFLGELVIEGFSTYMQSFGDNRLMGIGRGANTSDIKVSLFDTTNDEPSEINSIIIENARADALSDARAVLCEVDNNIFAFSATSTTQTGTVRGAYIFGVIGGKLAQIGFLPEVYPNMDYSRKHIKRIARVDDFILTISDAYISSYSLSEIRKNGTSADIDTVDTALEHPNFYTVSFITNFDSLQVTERQVEQDYYVTLPVLQDIEGQYEFSHWSQSAGLSATGSPKFLGTIRTNLTLYAKWYRLPWRTVSFDLNMPENTSSGSLELYTPSLQKIENFGQAKEEFINDNKNIVITNHKFDYWYKDDENVPFDFLSTIDDSFTLKAKWKPITTHTITIDYNLPKSAVGTSPSEIVIIVENGDTISSPYSGYRFSYKSIFYDECVIDYWYTNDEKTPYVFNTYIYSSFTLKAKWKYIRN